MEQIEFVGTREGGFIDGRFVKFWATKQQAVEGAKAIGWPANSVFPVSTRFQRGWALGNGCEYMTKTSYVALYEDRQRTLTGDPE